MGGLPSNASGSHESLRVALLVLALLAVARPAAAQRSATRVITYTVDTATDGELPA
jgi:hypothetical protein